VSDRPTAERLELLFSAQMLELLDEHVREVAADAVRQELARQKAPKRWLTLGEAASRLGCSYDAMRMRAERGTVPARRQGGRVYVLASAIEELDGAD
jgi:hypothetical protein